VANRHSSIVTLLPSDASRSVVCFGRALRLLPDRSRLRNRKCGCAATKAKKEDSATRTAFDDRELSEWVMALGEECSGPFLCALAEAVMKADAEDYSIIRPALVNLKCKYPDANSDRERAAAVIPDWRRAKRNSPSERRIEL
jgi:hypothetical protein